MRRVPTKVRLCTLVLALVAIGALWWDYQVAGNRPVKFFARVVDERGNGLPGVSVKIRISRGKFFSVPAPFIHGSQTKQLFYQVVTDESGNFQFSCRRGNALAVEGFEKAGYTADFINIPRGFAYDQLASQSNPIPFNEERRITYPMRRTRSP